VTICKSQLKKWNHNFRSWQWHFLHTRSRAYTVTIRSVFHRLSTHGA